MISTGYCDGKEDMINKLKIMTFSHFPNLLCLNLIDYFRRKRQFSCMIVQRRWHVSVFVSRRQCAGVRVGELVIGDGAPIAVQSMNNTDTRM